MILSVNLAAFLLLACAFGWSRLYLSPSIDTLFVVGAVSFIGVLLGVDVAQREGRA